MNNLKTIMTNHNTNNKPHQIQIELGKRSYSILIGHGLLQSAGTIIKKIPGLGKKVGLITNPTVGPLYANLVISSLEKEGYTVSQFTIPDGEKYKSLDTARDLYSKLISNGFDRDSFLIALGGGVIGDLTGFVAATYMRGIPFIQVPTTLEAQVDASVGGKVAVDLPEGKNLVGTFYQPRTVIIDPETLKTLPCREISSGLAEVIKYGIIIDEEFFSYLEDNIQKVFSFDATVLEHIITCSCEIKAKVVSKDEEDKGLRGILNYGHTIGHALETLTGYEALRHGEGVAIGMIGAAQIANHLKMVDINLVNRLTDLIKSIGLPSSIDSAISVDKIIQTMYKDKKVKDGNLIFVLPEKIGATQFYSLSNIEILRETLISLQGDSHNG